jgi:predicted secreted protein
MAGSFANGAVFKIGSTTISEITTISAPNLSAETIDVTTHSSAGSYREFIKGLRDGGEISIEGNFTTASASATIIALETSSTNTVTIDYPTKPSTTRFTASVLATGFTMEAPVDGVIPFTATFKVTGQPTLGQI